YRAVAAELLGHTDASRHMPRMIDEMSPADQRDAIARAVAAMHRSAQHTSEWTVPLAGVAFDDPRMSRWVSDVLTGPTGREAHPRLAYLDVPRSGITTEDNPWGVSFAGDYGRPGKVWTIEDERHASVSMIEADDIVQVGDGSHQPGVSFSAALEDYARVITRKMLTDHT